MIMPVVPLDAPRLAEGLAALAAADPDIARGLEAVGPPEPRVRAPGFATLLRIIVAQQVSTRAAAAIWGRLEGRLEAVTPAAVLALGDRECRACGLSWRKSDYARGLAEAVAERRVDLDALADADDEEAIATIAALKGLGRWSAEIYLLFALGRADIFPADDLAIREALVRLKGLPGRINGRAAREVAEAWRPWRGCAAIFLWHYYGAATLDRT